MMLLCFLRKRLLGLFLPFILVLASFWARWPALVCALAARAAALVSCLTSSGSRCTCSQVHAVKAQRTGEKLTGHWGAPYPQDLPASPQHFPRFEVKSLAAEVPAK